MDFRARVYSPLQDAAVWLGAWLLGKASYDELTEVFIELFGSVPSAEFLRDLRTHAPDETPILRLALSGPGDPHGLVEDAAILCGTIVLSPVLDSQGVTVAWNWREHHNPIHLPFHSPGDASRMLTEATIHAAQIIEQNGGMKRNNLSGIRANIGKLNEFYDAPGLPAGTDHRAIKLFSQANQLAAILETMHVHVQDHSFDPQLIGLWKHLRRARITGVDCALREFARE